MDDRQSTIPKGLFKRETKGKSLPPVTVSVERGRIRFFAQVLGETDPIHLDLDEARAKGHPDLVAPPSFFMVVEALANEERRRRGEVALAELIGCDYRYLLHGNEHYDYEQLIFAGDEVSLTTSIVDFYDKKGGAMEFVSIESVIEHAERGVLVRATRTLLHKLA